MLTINHFDYHLPTRLIAQYPVSPRHKSKLLYLNRSNNIIKDAKFEDLPIILKEIEHKTGKKTVLVRNNTKVIPARLFGKKPSGGDAEVLLLKRISIETDGETWQCLTKPGLKAGQSITFGINLLIGTVKKIDGYIRHISFTNLKNNFATTIHQVGHTPLPPYIEWDKHDESELRNMYQTTYAKVTGSAAAPTAGFHFSPELNNELSKNGIQFEEVTLHVGLGTFQPVKEKQIHKHTMHSEWFYLSPQTAAKLNTAKKANKNIISIGTTTTRVLESCVNKQTKKIIPQEGETNIFIYPPYQFQFIDGLITNFHLPQSTLLMLISAFVSQPNTAHNFTNFESSIIGTAYHHAINQNYRFYSFGDGMLLF